MDSLVESARTYVEVLRNCSSALVADWKQEDLERAVNWAEYFKRKKPALVGKFDAQLKEIQSQTVGRFGQQALSAEFLGGSLDYLIGSLLENPSLPEGIKQLVCERYATGHHQKQMEKFATSQALFKTLTAVHNRLSTHAPPFLKRDPVLVADGVVLQEELEWILSSHTQSPHTVAHAKLNDLVRQERGMEVILFSVISRASPSSESKSSAIILKWLKQCLQTMTAVPTHKPDDQQDARGCGDIPCKKFWALSPELLAGVAVQSLDFFRLLYRELSLRVNQLQTELLEKFEKDRCTETGVYLDRLEVEVLCYFRALMTVDERVKEITVALVETQVQETAAKVLGIGMTSSPEDSSSTTAGLSSESCPAKLPTNLWRKALAILDQ